MAARMTVQTLLIMQSLLRDLGRQYYGLELQGEMRVQSSKACSILGAA